MLQPSPAAELKERKTRMAEHPDRESAVLFGKVTANITHEIKNSLAIIKEIAGLQCDLIAAASKGRTLEPERLDGLACRITSQVLKADAVVKRMNRFAHTVDSTKKTIDMREEISFIISLVDRLFQMRGILVHLEAPQDPVIVETDPFKLVATIVASMQVFMDCLGKGTELTIHVQPMDGGTTVGFSTNEKNLTLPPDCQGTVACAMEGLEATVKIPGKDYPMELVYPAY